VERLTERYPENGVHVERIRYHGCREASQVEMLRVVGGGHQWYGFGPRRWLDKFLGRSTREIDADEVIWRFFDTGATTVVVVEPDTDS